MKYIIVSLFLAIISLNSNPPWSTIYIIDGVVSESPPDSANVIIENGLVRRYYIDSTLNCYYGYPHFLSKHINKGFTSLGTLPDNADFSEYEKYDTLNLVVSYNIKESGLMKNHKRNGQWTFYADPFDNDSFRLYKYTLNYNCDTIAGPYNLIYKNDTIVRAEMIDHGMWKVFKDGKTDTITPKIFNMWFLCNEGDIRAVRLHEKENSNQ